MTSDTLANPLSIAPLCISALALVVALTNYRRKSGMLVRGSFSTAASRACDDQYLSSLVIENLKDRAITVFAIYLRLGSSYYVEIEDFGEKPLVLRAFEVYQKEYGPIEFYGVSTKRIDLNALFSDRRTKKRLVLSTGDGKYVVRAPLRKWNPVYQALANYMTAVVRPVHGTYKGKYIGGRIRYVLDISRLDGGEEIIPIHPNDFEVNVFVNFAVTKEALESKEKLETFLQRQADTGKLSCSGFTVFDMQKWRDKEHAFYSDGTISARPYSVFQYTIGQLHSTYLNWKQRRENAKRLRSQPGKKS